MIIKFIGCILILIATTGAGFMYSEKYRKRVIQLKEFERTLLLLENQMEYTHTPLPEAFLNISKKAKEPVNLFFKGVSDLLNKGEVENVNEAFNEAFKKNKALFFLNETDIDVLNDLSKSLGCFGISGEKSVFNLINKNLKTHIEDSEEKAKKNVKMYRYLGFFMGAVIILIIV